MLRLPEHQVARFLLVGGLNAAFGFVVFSALALTGWPNWVSILGGNLAGIAFNFMTTGGLVFRQRGWSRLPRFIACYAVLLTINTFALGWLEPMVGSKLLAQALLTPPLALISYLIMSRWVFPKT